MDHHVDVAFVVDTFLLFLIGLGPKIALVPFLDATAAMDSVTQRRVTLKMLRTAGIVAILLLLLGELLTRLLHFSTGALSIAGGIVLLILAVTHGAEPGREEGCVARGQRPHAPRRHFRWRCPTS